MICGDFQKDLLKNDLHRRGIEHPVGAWNMAAMMVVGGGILVVVVGRKLFSVGTGIAVRGAPVPFIMRVAVNQPRPKPCKHAEEKQEADWKTHVPPIVRFSLMGKFFFQRRRMNLQQFLARQTPSCESPRPG